MVDREEVWVWVGLVVMDRFGSLLWFCGCLLVWSLRRVCVGSSSLSWWCSIGVLAGCGQGHGAFRIGPFRGSLVVLAKGTSGPPSASREPLTVTFATAKSAVPNATNGILTLPLGHSNFGSYEPSGALASRGKKTGVSHETSQT